MQRTRRIALWSPLVATAALLSPAPSVAQTPGPPIASAAGRCDSNVTDFATGPVAGDHPEVVGRLSTQGAGGDYRSRHFGSGDTVWSPTSPLRSGESGEERIICFGTTDFTLELFDVPVPPASFSGSSNPDRDGSGVVFRAPGAGQYVADVSVTQGAVAVSTDGGSVGFGQCGLPRRQVFASVGQFQFGLINGKATCLVNVRAEDGPVANWTVAFRAIPGAVTGLKFARATARSGRSVRASYQLTADARLSAVIRNSSGQTVRTLGGFFSAARGSRTLTWDGINASGRPVRSGRYALEISGEDVNGFALQTRAPLIVDNGAPKVRRLSPRRLVSTRALVIGLEDQLSGVRSARLNVGGRTVRRLSGSRRSTSRRLIYRPRTGWSRGRSYRYAVLASDRAGNRRRVAGRFAIR